MSRIIEWDITEETVINEFEYDRRISNANYNFKNEDTIVWSGALPFFLHNFTSQEFMINISKYESEVDALSEKSEKWIAKPLEFSKKQWYVLFTKEFSIFAVLEASEFNSERPFQVGHGFYKENYVLSHTEVRSIIDSTERIENDQDMDLDVHSDNFKTFSEIISSKLTLKAYACLNCDITSFSVFQTNSLVIANWSDKSLRLFDVSDETLSTLPEVDKKIMPFRIFTDIILKRKFAGGMFYKVPDDNDIYLLTGIEKAGELIAYSTKLGSQYSRVGNWKEGWESFAYFYNDMKNYMVAFITSMSSVVIWKKPIIKNFAALSPNFEHIEQNTLYIKPENDDFDENADYIEPRIDLKLSNCFKVSAKSQETKSLPAKTLIQSMIPKETQDFISQIKKFKY